MIKWRVRAGAVIGAAMVALASAVGLTAVLEPDGLHRDAGQSRYGAQG
jgi:hypothetical protein